jgi:hypothetical protein
MVRGVDCEETFKNLSTNRGRILRTVSHKVDRDLIGYSVREAIGEFDCQLPCEGIQL